MADETDHDILIKLQADICWIRKQLSNHLKHHWMLTLSLAGIVLAGVVTIIVKQF